MIFGVEELKKEIEITKTTVECPVKDCNEKVDRRRRNSEKGTKFTCPKHNISISASTFVYPGEFDNVLWKEREDRALLKKIKTAKRENRMKYDNSEDAVSWNVFRFLEKNDLIKGFLNLITDNNFDSSEVIYWSYSQKENSHWSALNKAREEFGERIEKGSEPDIIIKTDKALFFIEAKLTAGNKTVPSHIDNSKKYETGGNNWFSEVLKSDYKAVAIDKKKYELLRFWLLGTWIAKQQDLDFYLVNLVLSEREAEIEAVFNAHIIENQRRKFLRVTWEMIYEYASKNPSKDTVTMMRYFRNKTIGYDRNGKLQRAFSVI